MSKKNNGWIKKHINDIFVRKAQESGYVARSAYKLIEINNKYNIFKKANNILELGAAPGGWTQVVLELTKAKIFAIDLLPMHHKISSDMLEFSQCNYLDFIPQCNIKFNLILSDISPNLTGIRDVDLIASRKILDDIVLYLEKIMEKNGHLIVKIFRAHDDNMLIKQLLQFFSTVKIFKPQASRSESNEAYIICMSYINLY